MIRVFVEGEKGKQGMGEYMWCIRGSEGVEIGFMDSGFNKNFWMFSSKDSLIFRIVNGLESPLSTSVLVFRNWSNT